MKYKAIVNNNKHIDIEFDTSEGSAIHGHSILVNGEKKDIHLVKLSENMYQLIYNGQVFLGELSQKEGNYIVRFKDELLEIELLDEKKLLIERMGIKAPEKKTSGQIKSPMPGLVVELSVKVGDEVKQGEGLLVLEAMKMQNEIKSPIDGVVQEIAIKENEPVEKNQLLLKIG